MRIFKKCASVSLFALLGLILLATTAFADVAENYGEELASYDVSADGASTVTVKLYEHSDGYSLVASGEGEMREFSSSDEIPWLEYADRIVRVTVERGVKSLSSFFFRNSPALEELWIYEAHLTFAVDKQYIPYTARIYGHFNSTAHIFVFENYPSRFFPICDFSDSVCSVCGYTCEEHSGGAPSCTAGGMCEICGVEYLPSSGHKLSAPVSEKPATCYSPGMSAHYFCISCDALFDENGEPATREELEFTTGHDLGELIKYEPPTCTQDGTLAHYECSFCHKLFDEDKQEIEDASISYLGHIGGEESCLSGALCERCNTEYTEPNPLNHSYGQELKYNESAHWNECACGAKNGESRHILTDKTVKEATESEMGVLESSCDCGYKTQKYIPKLAPTVDDRNDDGEYFPTDKLIIIIISSILLCGCLTAIVIIIIKLKKGN